MTPPFPRDQTSEKALAWRVVPHMTKGASRMGVLHTDANQWRDGQLVLM
jgi:hypothetical protein